MNETIYRLAEEGASIRIVLQKKPDGDFILGISNGKYKALICQGAEKQVDAEFEAALPGYLEELKAAAIEAQLRAAVPASTRRCKTSRSFFTSSVWRPVVGSSRI